MQKALQLIELIKIADKDMQLSTMNPPQRQVYCIGEICILGIGLELACSGGSCREESDKCYLHLK